jgi:hypothetical protein
MRKRHFGKRGRGLSMIEHHSAKIG